MNNDNIQPMIERYKRELLELSRKNSKAPLKKTTAEPAKPAVPPLSQRTTNPAEPARAGMPQMPPMNGNQAGTMSPGMSMPPMAGNQPGPMSVPPSSRMPETSGNNEQSDQMSQMQQPFMPYRDTDQKYYSGEHYIPYEEFVHQASRGKVDDTRRSAQNMPKNSNTSSNTGEQGGSDSNRIPQIMPSAPYLSSRPGGGIYDDYNIQHHQNMPDASNNPSTARNQSSDSQPLQSISDNQNMPWGLGDEDEIYDDLKMQVPKIRPTAPNNPSRTGEQVEMNIGSIPTLPPTAGNNNIDLRRSQIQPSAPYLPSKSGERADTEISQLPSPESMSGNTRSGSSQNMPGTSKIPSGSGSPGSNIAGNLPPIPPISTNTNTSQAKAPFTSGSDTPTGSFTLWNEEPYQAVIANMPESRALQAATGTTGNHTGASASTQPGTGSSSPSGGRLFLNRQYTSIEEFNQVNPKKGFLKVQVFAGDRAFPIVGAHVIVFRDIDGKNYTFFDKITDISGLVTGLELPAPDKNLSLKPTDIAPYSTYNIAVDHPKFVSAEFDNVPIFDGIESIQPARMIPKVEGAGTPQVKRTIEIQPHDL